MKRILFFVFLIIFVLIQNIYAQGGIKAGVTVGLSFPFSDFAKTDKNDSTSGFAQTGLSASIEGAYFLTQNLGLLGIFYYGIYSTDADALAKGFAEEIANLTGQTTSVKTEVGSWGVRNFMPGIIFLIPIDEKISVNVKAAGGLMIATSPELKATADISGFGTIESKQTSATSSAFAFLIGGGGTYKLSDKLELQANVDYMSGTPEFEFEDESGQKTKAKQTISAIGIKAGIGILLK